MARNKIVQAWGHSGASKSASKQLRAFGYNARAKRSDAGKRRVIKPRKPKPLF